MLLPKYSLQEKVYFYMLNKNKENSIESYTVYDGVISAINIKKHKEINIFNLEYTITNYSGRNYREESQIYRTRTEIYNKVEDLLDKQ